MRTRSSFVKMLFSAAFLVTLMILGSLPASADCPDIPYTCPFGGVFLRGTCWEFPKGCVPCGNTDCPSYPRTYDAVSNRIDAKRCPRATERMDGCSAPVNDPASKAYKELFKGACNQHDFCYSTLASGKGKCDDDFRANMASICRRYYHGALNSLQLGNCLAAVGVWYEAVNLKGQSSYDGDQSWALNNCQPTIAKLRGKASGRVACIFGGGRDNGDPMHLYDYVDVLDQKWELVDAGGGYSYLKVQHTKKCLDLSNGAAEDGGRLQQWDCDSGTDNQKWKVERQGDGSILLQSKASGKCMTAPSGVENGTPVVQMGCTGADNQRWFLDSI